MKIRNGFVSNSSSSSYIVALPKGFDLQAELAKVPQHIFDVLDINRTVIDTIDYDNILTHRCYQCDDREAFYLLLESKILQPYIIMEFSGDSDEGFIHFMSDKEIEKVKDITTPVHKAVLSVVNRYKNYHVKGRLE